MEHCPVCSAATNGRKACRRCKMDFAPLIAVENDALAHIQKARSALEKKDAADILFHARRAFSLRKTKESIRLLAVAALLNRDYGLALAVRQYDQRG